MVGQLTFLGKNPVLCEVPLKVLEGPEEWRAKLQTSETFSRNAQAQVPYWTIYPQSLMIPAILLRAEIRIFILIPTVMTVVAAAAAAAAGVAVAVVVVVI